ncbi:Protein of unknown function [Pilibacter termitis]|uniref:DUF2800 domain-containing protein n=1 Tax=Pilibacter termitis TaxID=263852 RepID=A0A1T4PRL1_9ENTE|nr:DUF2800 domain-containing protein [Pilibacter termitis]SJZ94220.1 Protein of unknown function [Pilibacter termitis]
MTNHALLSASSSNRWIHCTPSARLGEQFENTTSEYAKQGTEVHALCEYKLQRALGNEAENPISTFEFYDEEMEECTTAYVTFVMEELAKAKEVTKDPIVIVEQKLDFSNYVPEGFGTGDCLIIDDETLTVIDLKYGLGVLVEAHENPQMMCYALGALNLFDGIYDIQKVKMTIFQPRRENISTYELTKEALYQWAEEVLRPKADLAYQGDGAFQCGKWCNFCPAKQVCKARAEQNMALAKYEFQQANLLTYDEIENILSKVDDLVNWATDIKEYALKQALAGKTWNDWKLVEGRAVRKYANEEEVAKAVENAGFNPYEQKLLGVTAMTKLLTKKNFEELLGDFIIKPKGKLTLVPKTDKRTAVKITTAREEFKHTEDK